MKDLIAKLQLDANCAMGAIWMHIDAQAARIAELEAQQAFGIGETYANALSRIAELEAQIASASAPVVEQKNLRALYLEEAAAKVEEMVEGIGDRAAYDHREMYDSETERMHAAIDFAAGIRSLIPASAPQAADTDKLREAISDEQIMRIAGDVKQRNARVWPGDVAFARAVLASTALQAPVREVPGYKLVPLEVTDAMLEAWKTELCVPIGSSPEAKARRAYRAMLAAAPVQQEGE